MEQITSHVQDMDAMYVVRWEDWFPKLSHCMLVSVMKPGDEDEGEPDTSWPVLSAFLTTVILVIKR